MEKLIQIGIVLYALAAAVSAWRRHQGRHPAESGIDMAGASPPGRAAGSAQMTDPGEGEAGDEGRMGDEGVSALVPETQILAHGATARQVEGGDGAAWPRTHAEWRRAFLGAILWGPPVALSGRQTPGERSKPRPIAYRPAGRS